MVEVEGLTRRFGELVAVDAIGFDVGAGEILGVLGPNGAGKTTTLRMLCGYLQPSAGTARVDGFDVTRDSVEVRRRIGYLPESNPLYPELRVVEYLRFRAGLKHVPARLRRARVDACIERCGLAGVARQTIGTLSRGFRQRVGLADALVGEPRVLVLDEPTAGLDPNQVHEFRDLVRALAGHAAVLFSSHQLVEVERTCDRVVIIDRGRLIADDTAAALRERVGAGSAVTLELPAAARATVDALAAGLATVRETTLLADGWLRVLLDETGADPRAALFERAAAAGITLRELSRRTPTLEATFERLTAGAREDGA